MQAGTHSCPSGALGLANMLISAYEQLALANGVLHREQWRFNVARGCAVLFPAGAYGNVHRAANTCSWDVIGRS